MEPRPVLHAGQNEELSRLSSRAHLTERLSGNLPGRRSSASMLANAQTTRGDHDLNPDLYPDRTLRPAAVLVPLMDRGDYSVLLTRRTAHLNAHAGQIAFPGGQVDPGDEGPIAAALREAEEEVGIPPENVEVLGALDTYVTRTGFEVTPVVGLVRPDFRFRLDRFEVEEAFEVPLRFFLTPDARQTHTREFEGRARQFYVYPYEDYYIWGATAGMLNNLVEVLTA